MSARCTGGGTGETRTPCPAWNGYPAICRIRAHWTTLVAGANAVIHCAGTVRGARSSDFERVNAEGAGRIAAAAAAQATAPRFLLMSSLAARVPELSDYAASKWHGECALKAAARDMRWTIFRPPAVFGPGDRELAPLFRCIARGFAPVPGHAAGRFSLIHVDDLASAVLRWLAVDTGSGRIFELDDGKSGGYDWQTVLAIAGPRAGPDGSRMAGANSGSASAARRVGEPRGRPPARIRPDADARERCVK